MPDNRKDKFLNLAASGFKKAGKVYETVNYRPIITCLPYHNDLHEPFVFTMKENNIALMGNNYEKRLVDKTGILDMKQ